MQNRRRIGIALLLLALLALGVYTRFVPPREHLYNGSLEELSPRVLRFMRTITHIGDGAAVVGVCLALLLSPRTRRGVGVPVSAAVAGTFLAMQLLKRIFSRPRPELLPLVHATGYSFPSGHAAVSAALYATLLALALRRVERRGPRAALAALCVALPLLIGYSRIYLGVHYISDVLGGFALGLSAAMLAVRLAPEETPFPS